MLFRAPLSRFAVRLRRVDDRLFRVAAVLLAATVALAALHSAQVPAAVVALLFGGVFAALVTRLPSWPATAASVAAAGTYVALHVVTGGVAAEYGAAAMFPVVYVGGAVLRVRRGRTFWSLTEGSTGFVPGDAVMIRRPGRAKCVVVVLDVRGKEIRTARVLPPLESRTATDRDDAIEVAGLGFVDCSSVETVAVEQVIALDGRLTGKSWVAVRSRAKAALKKYDAGQR